MKKYVLMAMLCFFTIPFVFSDNVTAVRDAVSGMILPTQNTDIVLFYEHLSFVAPKKGEKGWRVRAEMHFFNPSNAKSVECAFVTPNQINEDMPAELYGYFQSDIDISTYKSIRNFSTNANGFMIPFKKEIINYKRFPFIETLFSNDLKKIGRQLRFICFSFTISFKKGVNKILNEYVCDGEQWDGGIHHPFGENRIEYIISSGGYWAGGIIKYLKVTICGADRTLIKLKGFDAQEMKVLTEGSVKVYNNSYFFLTSDGKIIIDYVNFKPVSEFMIAKGLDYHLSPWEKISCGKTNINFSFFTDNVRTKNEIEQKLQKKDIRGELEFEGSLLEAALTIVTFAEMGFGRGYNEFIERIELLTPTSLRILRNIPYALQGYRFESQDLFLFFSQFDWYIPETSNEGRRYYISENVQKKYLEPILAAEKAKKNKE